MSIWTVGIREEPRIRASSVRHELLLHGRDEAFYSGKVQDKPESSRSKAVKIPFIGNVKVLTMLRHTYGGGCMVPLNRMWFHDYKEECRNREFFSSFFQTLHYFDLVKREHLLQAILDSASEFGTVNDYWSSSPGWYWSLKYIVSPLDPGMQRRKYTAGYPHHHQTAWQSGEIRTPTGTTAIDEYSWAW